MEPEAPWAVDQAIASRTGAALPQDWEPSFRIPAATSTRPSRRMTATWRSKPTSSTCPTPSPRFLARRAPRCSTRPPSANTNTWTPSALAELVVGLGGAVVATHSQSGSIGHHMVRILKEHGKLSLLKGLITIEGSCALDTAPGSPPTGRTSRTFPTWPSRVTTRPPAPTARATVDAIKAAGGKADYIQLDQPGVWQGKYTGPFGPGLRRSLRRRLPHDDDREQPGPDAQARKATNLQVMDVMLEWTEQEHQDPRVDRVRLEDDHDHDDDDDDHHHH